MPGTPRCAARRSRSFVALSACPSTSLANQLISAFVDHPSEAGHGDRPARPKLEDQLALLRHPRASANDLRKDGLAPRFEGYGEDLGAGTWWSTSWTLDSGIPDASTVPCIAPSSSAMDSLYPLSETYQ